MSARQQGEEGACFCGLHAVHTAQGLRVAGQCTHRGFPVLLLGIAALSWAAGLSLRSLLHNARFS